MQEGVGKEESLEETVTRSWKHTRVKVSCHGHGTCHLKVYKKNLLWVFLSKKERFWPWLEEPKFVKDIIS